MDAKIDYLVGKEKTSGGRAYFEGEQQPTEDLLPVGLLFLPGESRPQILRVC